MSISVEETRSVVLLLEKHAPPACRGILRDARILIEDTIKEAEHAAIRERPVTDLEASVRTLAALQKFGCKTIGDVERLVKACPTSLHVVLQGKRVAREAREIIAEVFR